MVAKILMEIDIKNQQPTTITTFNINILFTTDG